MLFEKISQRKRKKSPQVWASHNQMRSLNTTFRKQQIENIERENVKMFSRIQRQKASISFREVDKEYNKTRVLSTRLSSIEKHRLYDWY